MATKALKNVRKLNQQVVYLSEFMTAAQWADYRARTLVYDLTTPIQNAIDELTAGGRVEMGSGFAKITDEITSDVEGVVLNGDGPGATGFSVTGSGYDAITLTGNYSGIQNLSLTSPTIRTAGAGISVDVGFSCSIYRVNLFNQFKAIYLGASVFPTVDLVNIRNCGATTGGGVHVNGGNDQILSRIVMDNDGTQPAYGLWVQKSGAVWADACDFIRSGTPVKFAPEAGEEISWCFFERVASDTSSGNGLHIIVPATAIVKGIHFVSGWTSSNTLQGVRIEGAGTIDGIEFTGHRSLNNGLNGLQVVSAGAKNIRINGGAYAGNSQTTPDTYAGIEMGVDVSDFSITDTKCGDSLGFTGTTQQRGIIVQAGASDRYTITGNDLLGNNLEGLTDGGTGTNKIVSGNLGHVTRNGGTGSVLIGTNTIAVTHGMAGTPAPGDINVNPATLMTAAGINAWVLTAVGATTFSVTTDTNVSGANFTFEWNARIKGA